ncbi:serine threonine- kinase ATR-like isoform X1, putative [Babesia ovata]|uniref:Serine threonine-kinase ATR-like isoform X1, putative n=1 Tax=Babesia ovata TaxID=189622 RepID=A0A2H6KGT8_9APIC|nr:serine threonine- kinase ATR-like isoform X1, putative [Babesia ovata]GBE62206.1 serine threonine- kinase ATR-like isoform X1, putative [Babesia ovata]
MSAALSKLPSGAEEIRKTIHRNLLRAAQLTVVPIQSIGHSDVEQRRYQQQGPLLAKLLLLVTRHPSEDTKSHRHVLLCGVVAIWRTLFAQSDSNVHSSPEAFRRHSLVVDDLLEVSIALFAQIQNEENSVHLYMVLLEILTHSNAPQHKSAVLNALAHVPNQSVLVRVYPGLVSRIVRVLPRMRESDFRRAITVLEVWIKAALACNCGGMRCENAKDSVKETWVHKTSEAVTLILDRYRAAHTQKLGDLCAACMSRNCLPTAFLTRLLDHVCMMLSREALWEDAARIMASATLAAKLALCRIVDGYLRKHADSEMALIAYQGYAYVEMHVPGMEPLDEYVVLGMLYAAAKPPNDNECVPLERSHLLALCDAPPDFALFTEPREEVFSRVAAQYISRMPPSLQVQNISEIVECFVAGVESEMNAAQLLTLLRGLLSHGTTALRDVACDVVEVVVLTVIEPGSSTQTLCLSALALLCVLFSQYRLSVPRHQICDILFWLLPWCVADSGAISHYARSLLLHLGVNHHFASEESGSGHEQLSWPTSNTLIPSDKSAVLQTLLRFYKTLLVNRCVRDLKLSKFGGQSVSHRVSDVLFVLLHYRLLGVKDLFDLALHLERSWVIPESAVNAEMTLGFSGPDANSDLTALYCYAFMAHYIDRQYEVLDNVESNMIEHMKGQFELEGRNGKAVSASLPVALRPSETVPASDHSQPTPHDQQCIGSCIFGDEHMTLKSSEHTDSNKVHVRTIRAANHWSGSRFPDGTMQWKDATQRTSQATFKGHLIKPSSLSDDTFASPTQLGGSQRFQHSPLIEVIGEEPQSRVESISKPASAPKSTANDQLLQELQHWHNSPLKGDHGVIPKGRGSILGAPEQDTSRTDIILPSHTSENESGKTLSSTSKVVLSETQDTPRNEVHTGVKKADKPLAPAQNTDEAVAQQEDDPEEAIDGVGCEESSSELNFKDHRLAVVTLISTRCRYHLSSASPEAHYVALFAMYRSFCAFSRNVPVMRVRLYECWDALMDCMERSMRNLRSMSLVLGIMTIATRNAYNFVERWLVDVFAKIADLVVSEAADNCVTSADEAHGSVRFKFTTQLLEFVEEVSSRVVNRSLFANLLLIALLMCRSTAPAVERATASVLQHLFRKNPAAVTKVLMHTGSHTAESAAVLRSVLERDVRRLLPQRTRSAGRVSVAPDGTFGVLRNLLRRRGNPIALEGCSAPRMILRELEARGIPVQLSRANGVKSLAPSVCRAINELYQSNNFFASRVAGHEVSPDGRRLTVKCAEQAVPVANFRFFVRDPEHGAEVDVGNMQMVRSSSSTIPRGKFTEEPNGALQRLLFGRSGALARLDPALFNSVKGTGLWSNLEYAIWRAPDGKLYMHCYCDGRGVTRKVDYTVANLFSGGGAQLRAGLMDLDLLGTGIQGHLGAKIALGEWYKMSKKHRLSASLTYDSLRKAIWMDRAGDTVAFTVAAHCRARDLMRILRLRKSETGEGVPKASLGATVYSSAGPDRYRLGLAGDAETLQLRGNAQSTGCDLLGKPVSTQQAIAIKVPVETLSKRDGSWRDKVYVRCQHKATAPVGACDVALGVRYGSDMRHSGFRGKSPSGRYYLMLAGEVTRRWLPQKPWTIIRPGMFLDILCALGGSDSVNTPRVFAFSAGVIVKVLGLGVSLAITELPRNMPGGLKDVLTALKQSFYMQSA